MSTRYHHDRIETVRQLADSLRAGRYSPHGSYPMFFVTTRGDALSFEGVRERFIDVARAVRDQDDTGWNVCRCVANYENTGLYCDCTGEPIECAYGELD